MDYSKFTLGNGTEIYVVSSPLYTHTLLTVNFYSRSGTENAARTLGSIMLNEGTKEHASSQLIEAEAEKHFGAAIGAGAATKAGLHVSMLSIDVLTRPELTGNENTLEAMAGLMAEMLYRPLIIAGKFNQGYFEVKQQEIGIAVKMEAMNKENKAAHRFMEVALGAESPFAAKATGIPGDVEKISNMEAVWAWERIYETASRRIFAATNLSPESIMRLCSEHFSNLPNICNNTTIGPVPAKNAGTVEEESGFDQSMVYVGFPVAVPETSRERLALRLLNMYIGGYGNARLEDEIRQKRDMAYYARSRLSLETGLLYGVTGVDLANKDTAVEIMTREIRKAAEGKITKGGFNRAKRLLRDTHMRAMHTKSEKLEAIERLVLTGKGDEIESYEDPFKDISYDDVVKAAARIINAPVTYCLLGGKK